MINLTASASTRMQATVLYMKGMYLSRTSYPAILHSCLLFLFLFLSSLYPLLFSLSFSPAITRILTISPPLSSFLFLSFLCLLFLSTLLSVCHTYPLYLSINKATFSKVENMVLGNCSVKMAGAVTAYGARARNRKGLPPRRSR